MQPSPPKLAEEKKTLAIVALVCGICGLLPLLGFAFGLTALITGSIVLARRKAGRGLALAGLITGVVTMLLNGLVVLAVGALFFLKESVPVPERRALPPAPALAPRPLFASTNDASIDVRADAIVRPAHERPVRMLANAKLAEMLTVLPPQEAAALRTDLASGEQRRLIPATMKLMRTRPEQPDPAMAGALTMVLLENSNLPLRINAARALENWGTAASLPALQQAAAGPDRLLQLHAQKAIAKISAGPKN